MKILCLSYLAILYCLSLGALVIQKRIHNKKSKIPFCEPRLRPAGESLRLQLEKLDEKLDASILSIASSITLTLVLFVTLPPKWWDLAGAGVIAWILLLICSIVTVLFSIKMLRQLRKRWNISLGFEGERFVGQILTNELVSLGCRVFHDIPFDGFNIDHVVVAPTGVFAIETKTRRKPIDKKKGRHEYEITYDGERLIFPVRMKPYDALEQTQRNARTLAKELCGALGRPINVKPVLVYPGWMVKTSKRGPVSVINPHMLKHVVFPNYNRSGDNDTPFDEELLNRISAQMTKLDTLDGK